MAKSNHEALGIHVVHIRELDIGNKLTKINRYVNSPLYKDILYYLQNLQCLLELTRSEKRSLRSKAMKYCLLGNELY